MTKVELERQLESRCVDKVETAGGLALKLQIPGVRGFPDRSVLMPGRRIWFFETKRMRTGRVSAQQHKWKTLLFQMGFPMYLIDNDEQFDDALRKETAR